jgi:hypothetical protein
VVCGSGMESAGVPAPRMRLSCCWSSLVVRTGGRSVASVPQLPGSDQSDGCQGCGRLSSVGKDKIADGYLI